VNAAAAADTSEPNWQRKLISRKSNFTGAPFEVDGQTRVDVHDGFAKFCGIGMGLALIACEELRAMVDRGIVREQTHRSATETVDYRVFGFFNRKQDEAGNLVSEDLSFCLRWRECGGEILAMLDEPIFHVGSHAFIGLFSEGLNSAERRNR